MKKQNNKKDKQQKEFTQDSSITAKEVTETEIREVVERIYDKVPPRKSETFERISRELKVQYAK